MESNVKGNKSQLLFFINVNTSKNYLLHDYCQFFSNLNVNTTKKRGNAPYQPLLLLSVIDLIAEDEIKTNEIYITDKLIARFNQYRKLLSSNTFKGNLVLPFFHLKNSEFWRLKFSDIYDGGRPQTIPKLKSDVDYALLDNNLFRLLQNDNDRQQLVDTLLEVYFTYNSQNQDRVVEINNNLLQSTLEEKKAYIRRSVIRNAIFRKSVVYLYNYSCAFCRMKVQSAIRQNIVDGAHIKPLSIFNDNNIGNGISLCKNHHWAFDNGLFSADENYKIIVAKNFAEHSPYAKSIKQFEQEKLLLPTSIEYFPRLDALEWHRNHVFLNK